MALLQQIPRADTDNKERSRLPTPHEDMPDAVERRRAKHHLPEIDYLRPHRIADSDNLMSRGCLLPRIGDHNPDRAEMRPERHHYGCEEMHLRADLVPPEQEYGQKSGLKEERKYPLRR